MTFVFSRYTKYMSNHPFKENYSKKPKSILNVMNTNYFDSDKKNKQNNYTPSTLVEKNVSTVQ